MLFYVQKICYIAIIDGKSITKNTNKFSKWQVFFFILLLMLFEVDLIFFIETNAPMLLVNLCLGALWNVHVGMCILLIKVPFTKVTLSCPFKSVFHCLCAPLNVLCKV